MPNWIGMPAMRSEILWEMQRCTVRWWIWIGKWVSLDEWSFSWRGRDEKWKLQREYSLRHERIANGVHTRCARGANLQFFSLYCNSLHLVAIFTFRGIFHGCGAKRSFLVTFSHHKHENEFAWTLTNIEHTLSTGWCNKNIVSGGGAQCKFQSAYQCSSSTVHSHQRTIPAKSFRFHLGIAVGSARSIRWNNRLQRVPAQRSPHRTSEKCVQPDMRAVRKIPAKLCISSRLQSTVHFSSAKIDGSRCLPKLEFPLICHSFASSASQYPITSNMPKSSSWS